MADLVIDLTTRENKTRVARITQRTEWSIAWSNVAAAVRASGSPAASAPMFVEEDEGWRGVADGIRQISAAIGRAYGPDGMHARGPWARLFRAIWEFAEDLGKAFDPNAWLIYQLEYRSRLAVRPELLPRLDRWIDDAIVDGEGFADSYDPAAAPPNPINTINREAGDRIVNRDGLPIDVVIDEAVEQAAYCRAILARNHPARFGIGIATRFDEKVEKWEAGLDALAEAAGEKTGWDHEAMFNDLLKQATKGPRLSPRDRYDAINDAIARVKSGGLGVALSGVRETRVEWLWVNRIPRGKITTIDSDPGLGKSTLSIELAAHVSRGKPFHDGSPCPEAGVLLLSGEDDPADTIKPRLRLAGGDQARVIFLGPSVGELPDVLPKIEEIVVRSKIGLVVIDPLESFLSDNIDPNKNADLRRVLGSLAGMAERTRAAVVVIGHLNKRQGDSPLYRSGGSIARVAAARAAYAIARDPDDTSRRVIARLKCNLVPETVADLAFRLLAIPGEDVGRIEWCDPPSGMTTVDLLSGVSRKPGKLEAAKFWLAAQLGDGEKAQKKNRARCDRARDQRLDP